MPIGTQAISRIALAQVFFCIFSKNWQKKTQKRAKKYKKTCKKVFFAALESRARLVAAATSLQNVHVRGAYCFLTGGAPP